MIFMCLDDGCFSPLSFVLLLTILTCCLRYFFCPGFFRSQWKEGDAEPASWMAHYRQNPCVPIDYSSVQAALQLAAPTPTASTSRYHHKTTSATQQQLQQVRSLKIWMRPGRFHLQQAIQVQAPPGVELVIETMQLPANIFQKPPTLARR